MRRRLLGPVVTAAVMVLSSLARAQDAQALFDEGLANMKAGRYKIGCALIKKSLDVDATAGTVFTLAECYSRAGKYASAVSFYDHFISLYEAMPKDEQAQQQARADISRTERSRLIAQVAWITVILPPLSPPGVAVTLDGDEFPASLFGIATAVDPGPHVFTTHVPDGPLIEQRVDISPGERKAISLQVRAPVPPEPPQPPEPEPHAPRTDDTRSTGLDTWMWTSFGIGAAGLVTGTVTGVLLLQDRTKILNGCPSNTKDSNGGIQCNDSGWAAVQRARTLAPVTTVALSVGAAGAVAGVILLIANNSSSSPVHAGTVPIVGFAPGGGTLGFSTTW